jgi:CubicO group peptidase (beta-lactamase class C family)
MTNQTKTRYLFIVMVFLLAIASSSCVGFQDDERIHWPTEDWQVEYPEDLNSELIEAMFEEIEETDLNLHGLVVVHQGSIVIEKYYSPYSELSLHESYSITKSVISALVGIAIQQGCLESTEELVLDYFPDREFLNMSDYKEALTIEHLLTQSSGLYFDQKEMVTSKDWIQYTLDQPIFFEPGESWYYSNGGPHVLSALINKACGVDTEEFAHQYIFTPLGIEDYRWQRVHPDYPVGSWGLSMAPRDLAKFGYLYLRNGIWDGEQILPENWVDLSSQPYFQIPDPFEPWDLHYGYLWWVHGDGFYAAHGIAGQFVYLHPEMDLVVVITGSISDNEFVEPQLLIRDYIVPALGVEIDQD